MIFVHNERAAHLTNFHLIVSDLAFAPHCVGSKGRVRPDVRIESGPIFPRVAQKEVTEVYLGKHGHFSKKKICHISNMAQSGHTDCVLFYTRDFGPDHPSICE